MPARRPRRRTRRPAALRRAARRPAARRRPAPHPPAGPAPARPAGRAQGPTLRAFQQAIEATYGTRDRARGLEATFMWLAEEVGELSRALRGSDRGNLEEEFADVLAWLCTLASLAGVDMARASAKYGAGCPRCAQSPCACRHRSPTAPPGPARGPAAHRARRGTGRPRGRRPRAR